MDWDSFRIKTVRHNFFSSEFSEKYTNIFFGRLEPMLNFFLIYWSLRSRYNFNFEQGVYRKVLGF